ncbi:hypothetical protein [Adhaeribacter aquaticus]|uniref:hypothetical protein n=1 Tax=Adhaeribacter aquaticus TaxID=299567 RepID=UPI0004132D20|nr:hypothetical protein [Adhaeribacter aquaticus]
MKIFRRFIALILTISVIKSYAQLNNSALLYSLPVKPEYKQDLRFGFRTLGFMRDNEYTNDIAAGYTLFGYHLNPRLVYFPAQNVRIEGGVFLLKDFGNPKLQQVQPTFTVKVQNQKSAFIFGTLEGNLNHGYIEPLLDFERVITNTLENGTQYLLKTKGLTLDAWIDWQRMLYRGENAREEIFGGITAEKKIFETTSGWRLGVPLQFTAQHKGGQIDVSNLPLLTLLNGATGFNLQKKLQGNFFQSFTSQNFWVFYKDQSNVRQVPFASGQGLYLNAGLNTKAVNVMLSYWDGHNYYAEKGGQLFSSASTTVKKPNYLEPDRRLLIVRFMRDFPILDNLSISTRFEPVFDLNNPQTEFSLGVYVHYYTDFFITRVREN